jgi:hypothetical protein
MVQVYLNEALDASLKAGNAEHPKGAAAVKELFTGGNLSGWAVGVKTADSSQSGAGWYWYEVMSATDGSSPVAAANGPNFCSSCHGAGADYFFTTYPLLCACAAPPSARRPASPGSRLRARRCARGAPQFGINMYSSYTVMDLPIREATADA